MSGPRHLRPVARGRRLDSRREIEAWAAERYATLTALARKEPVHGHARDHAQLELGQVA